VVIDRLRWWHIQTLLPIEADLFGAEQWTAGMFWSELANGNYYVAAFEEGELIGYAGLAVNSPYEAWVNNVAVRRDHQRRGVGRALVDDLLAEARRRGSHRVLLEVAADNGPAQKLYSSYGFDVVAVRQGYYQATGADALVMRRDEP
jgi:[ribosomal protein S18]-alanine N-acetyltransferase